ncbi:hypothetical protein HGRIS_000327 [Hohenbuehelia grisea]|uniref:Adenine DNA glycosylase n=1 Tax=Hohenbuehelia grisea TaxID=104357 RepID=A0ABR3JSA6_9AGAR
MVTRFPTVGDLAAASIDEVNSLWKGLGYYSRASRLLAGAQKVMKDFDGRMPKNASAMETLPGIGRYSAGAICSISYGECVPVLDGNVHRLLSRFLALHAPPKAKPTLDILWSAAEAIVKGVKPTRDPIIADAGGPTLPSVLPSVQADKLESATPADLVPHVAIGYAGDVNQALIELGSTVCKVRDPDCGRCPLRDRCAGFSRAQSSKEPEEMGAAVPDIEELCSICEPVPHAGGVLVYPMKADRKKAREEMDLVSVAEWRSRSGERWFLLVKRPAKGLLAGLLEFPTKENVTPKISSTACTSQAKACLATLLVDEIAPFTAKAPRKPIDDNSYRISAVEPAGDVLHVFSHIRKTYKVQWVLIEGGMTPPAIRTDSSKPPPSAKERRRSTKVRTSELRDEDDDSETAKLGPPSAAWVQIDNIRHSNITTGVQKIWDSVEKLWA